MSGASGQTRVYYSATSLTSMEDPNYKNVTEEFEGLGIQNFPRIARYENDVAIIWKQTAGISSSINLLLMENVLEGSTNSYDTVIYADNFGIDNADIKLSKDAIHVVWQDNNTGQVMYIKGTYEDSTTQINQNNGESFSPIVFPNPANELIKIYTEKNQITQVDLLNINGASISQFLLNSSTVHTIEVSDIPPGIYILKLSNTNGPLYYHKIYIQ